MDIGKGILDWYISHKRDLPWRNTRDPYKIWLSEIILQQTRVNQGLPYYYKFLKRFPTVFDLALAPQDEVLSAWQGLGYYSRALNLHQTAKQIAIYQGGKFPERFEELRKLKGIGDYTAAAITSFCFHEAVPVLDGNVFRVISRLKGIYTLPINKKGKEEYFQMAQNLMGTNAPDLFNQGMMEFGALLCKPQNPLCEVCPFTQICFAKNQDKIAVLPVKKIRKPLRKRYFNYIIAKEEGNYLVKKREEVDIWPGLFEFPLLESDKALEWEELKNENGFPVEIHSLKTKPELLEEIQNLSHQKIYFRFWLLQENSVANGTASSYLRVEEENLNQYAFPRAMHKLIQTLSDKD